MIVHQFSSQVVHLSSSLEMVQFVLLPDDTCLVACFSSAISFTRTFAGATSSTGPVWVAVSA